MKININIERLIRNILHIILILNIVSLFIFVFYSYKNFGFNSDSAVRVILAKEIYDSGNYFPKDWFFVNGDIWVFSAHTIMIPLLRFFPAGYGLYSIASAVMIAAILLSVDTIIKTLNVEKNTKLLILVIFTSGISLAVTENLYGQISYGLTVMYYFLLLSGFLGTLSQTNKGFNKNNILIFGLLVIIIWSNPLRGVVFYLIPLGLALAYYFIQCYKQDAIEFEAKCINQIIVIIIMSVITGVVLNKITLNNIQMNNGVTQLQWISLSEMIQRIPKIISSLLFILGGEPYANRSLLTISGMYDGFRLTIALCFIALVPLSIKKILKTEKNKNLKLFTVFTCGAFGIIVFLMISTNIYNGRYLLPAVVLMMVVVYAIRFDLNNNPLFDALRILTIVGFITNALVINTGYWATYRVSEALKDDSQAFSNMNDLAQYLKDNNLNYGYATFWNAGSVTVLSEETVKVRQIYMENGIPQKFKWQSANRWYMPNSTATKTFILLSKLESEGLDLKILKDVYKLVPETEINFNDYKIYIFNENISNKLTYWKN